MPNQYTKAEEEGRDKPKGANQFTTGKREKLDQATKDRLRAERAAKQLEAILDDPNATVEQKTAAAKALLPYGKSTYASVENTLSSEFEQMSEEEIKEQARALIISSPRLVMDVIDADPGFRAAIESHLRGQPVVVDAQQRAAA